MSVLVTGGKGFIGARMIRKLAARGEKVTCLELKTTGGRIADLVDRVTMVGGDVSRLEDVTEAIGKHGVERIAHMVFTWGDGSVYREVAVMAMGTCNVFEAARLAGVKRILFPSSIHYHGPQWLHGEKALTEEAPSLARTVYGAAKNLSEIMAHEYNERWGMSIISLRLPVVYGPGARVGGRGVNLAAIGAATGTPVTLPYPAWEKVCLAHVDDVADLCLRLLEAGSLKHEVYQMGGHTLAYAEIAAIAKEFVPDAEISFDDEAERINLPWLIDNSRLREELGFEHRSVREGFLELMNLTRQEAGLPPVG